MKWLLVGFVKAWRKLISPLYGPCCKYYPTCSEYALEALQIHGAIKGSALAAWRILRCNPWSRGGVDPVPGSALEAKTAQWLVQDVDGEQQQASRVLMPGTTPAPAVMG